MNRKIKNADFAKTNRDFNRACRIFEISPTTRQASKWRMKKGSAYKAFHFA